MKIPVYEPWLTDLEKKYAKQAIDSTWISSNGLFIPKVEDMLSKLYGGHAVVTANGTTALHLCCLAAGVKHGARVLVPACTYAATAFAPTYCGAVVNFVDVDPHTWNIDLMQIEQLCRHEKVDFVIPVHLFVNPVDMDGLVSLSDEYGFIIIEDACESIGASINGNKTGVIGDLSAISFYGNKTLTCIPFYEPIIINKNGLIEVIPISEAQARLPFKVPALQNNTLAWSDATDVIVHSSRKRCVRIKSSCGRQIDCSDDHLLFIYKNSTIIKTEAKQLVVGDYIVAPKALPEAKRAKIQINLLNIDDEAVIERNGEIIYEPPKRIPGGCRKGLPKIQTVDENLAIILGYYTAEGSTGPDRLWWTFALHEDTIEHLRQCWEERFPGWAFSRYERESSEQVCAGGKLHKAFFKHIGALGLAHTKRIPPVIFNSPPDIKLSYLRAYWRGDGCLATKSGKTYAEFKTVSKKLSWDLHYLLLTLSVPSTIESELPKSRVFPNGCEYKCKISYKIRVGDVDFINALAGLKLSKRGNIIEHRVPTSEILIDDNFDPAIKKRAKQKKSIGCEYLPGWEKTTNLSFLKIRSIEEIEYDDKWYDLKVPEGNSFIAGCGAILAHNCGEGGVVISKNKDLTSRARLLRGQAQSFDRRYWHVDIGYNYRMTNIQAAILCGQLERYEEILKEKQRVASRYIKNFKDDERVSMQRVMDGHKHGYWMIALKTTILSSILAKELGKIGIDTRPMFYPLNEMPPFGDKRYMAVSKSLSEKCLMLPSSPLLDDKTIDFVCGSIKKILDVSANCNNRRSI